MSICRCDLFNIILMPVFMSVVVKTKCTLTLAFVSQDDSLLVSGFHHHGNSNGTAYLLYGHIVGGVY